jgi:hypothetical protein
VNALARRLAEGWTDQYDSLQPWPICGTNCKSSGWPKAGLGYKVTLEPAA